MQICNLLLLCDLKARDEFVATARDLAVPPTINGQLEDGEWGNAAMLTNFSFGGSSGLAEVATDAYIAFDKKALYFGFYCQNISENPPKAIARDRDGPVYVDDAVEILIQPDLNSPAYYHFAGNSVGSIYDAKGMDSKWNGDWTYKVTQHKDHWEAEVCIPFSTLGMPVPMEGQSMGFNVCRDLPSRGPTSWTGAGSFHNLETFGRLQFSYVAPVIQAARITPSTSGKDIRLAELHNNTLKEQKVQLEGKIAMGSETVSSQAGTVTLPPGESESVNLQAPKPNTGSGPCSMTLRVEEGGAEIHQLLYQQLIQLPSSEHLEIKKYLFQGALKVLFNPTDLETDKLDGATAEFQLFVDDEKKATQTKAVNSIGKTNDVVETFDISALKTGKYMVGLQVCDKNNQPIVSESQSFDRPPQPEWFDSKLGFSDEVLPPWTPLQVANPDLNKVTISCWGRDYCFEGGALPVQVRNQGNEMLASPIVLCAEVNGHKAAWNKMKLKVLEKKANRVILRGEMRQEGLVIQADTALEYDGMGRVDLHLSGAPNVRLDALTLEIPMRTSQSPFIVAESDYDPMEGTSPYWSGVKNGRLPGRSVIGGFTPMIWLGDDYRGLLWFAESPRNWSNKDERKVIEIVSGNGDCRVLKVHFVDDSVQMNGPLDFTFGFQATPVKKAAKRQFYVMGSAYDNAKYLAANHHNGAEVVHFHEQWTETQGYPKTVKHQDQLLDWVKAVHENQMKAQLYLSYLIGDNCPEYKLYKDEILYEPMKLWMKWQRDDTDPPHTAYMCSYTGQWANFMLFELEKLIRKYDIDALYLDGTYYPGWDMNGAHGAGYVDRKGVRQPTRQIFAYREWMKRLRTLVNQVKPGFRLDMHDSTAFWIPTLSFGDSIFTGELTGTAIKAGKVSLRAPEFLDEFRASFSGTQYGFPVDFMDSSGDPNNAADMEAISYLHGTFLRSEAYGRYWQICKIYKEWGADESRWLPYFDNADYVKIEPESVKGSIYYQADKSIILVISNLSESKAAVKVDFNAGNIHMPPHAVAQDLLDDSVPVLNGNQLHLNLEPWKLYLIGIKEKSNHENIAK